MAAIKSVRELASRLRRLKTVPSRVSTPFAAYVQRESLKDFDAQRQIGSSTKWAPPSPTSIIKWGWRPPLGVVSGAMRASLKATPLQNAGIKLTVGGVQYMDFFMKGRIRQPARPILPKAMPKKWLEELQRMVDKEYQ